MRRVFGFMMLLAVCHVLVERPHSVVAAPPPETKTLPSEAARISDSLAKRFDNENRIELKLTAALRLIEERADASIILDLKALSGSRAQASIRPESKALVSTTLDENAFRKDLEQIEISLPAMRKVRLETALQYICDQFGAVSLIEGDHIKITSPAVKELLVGDGKTVPKVAGESTQDTVNLPLDERVRLTPTFCFNFENVLLQNAIKQLADRTGQNIVLSASAKDQAGVAVSLSLTNVTFETAAMTLAESSNLRAIKQGNVVLLVSEDRFVELSPKPMVLSGLNEPGLDQFAKLLNALKPMQNDSLKEELEKLKAEKTELENQLKTAQNKKKKSKDVSALKND